MKRMRNPGKAADADQSRISEHIHVFCSSSQPLAVQIRSDRIQSTSLRPRNSFHRQQPNFRTRIVCCIADRCVFRLCNVHDMSAPDVLRSK